MLAASVVVASPAGAQTVPDTTTPIGALESEVVALVEMGAFPGQLPPAITAVRARYGSAVAGLTRESLVTWVTGADRDGTEALAGLQPADRLSREVRTALGALPPHEVDNLRAGRPLGIDAITYERALDDLRLRNGAPPAHVGASTGRDGGAAPVVIPGVRPTFVPSTADRANDAPPSVVAPVSAGDSRAELLVVGVAVAAVAVAGALLLAGRRRRNALSELSLTDDLTELGNRRRLERDLDVAFGLGRRSVGFVMLDIDHFKLFNDTHGHLAGDETLRQVATILRRSVRDRDVVYRYGGEEFCVLLADADETEALAVAERLRAAVEAHDFPGAEQQPDGRLTISVGMSLTEALDAHSVKRCADEALYEAKRGGRNCVVVHSASSPPPA